MRRQCIINSLLLAVIVISGGCNADQTATVANLDSWPTWRGPQINGVAPEAAPPVTWSEEQNVRWKVAIPGRGSSTPVVWGDNMYLTTAISEPVDTTQQTEDAQSSQNVRNREGNRGDAERPRRRRRRGRQPTMTQFIVMAIDKNTGETVWQRTAAEAIPHEGTHPDGTWASNSAAVDAEHVYVSFGSRGLFCFDHNGNQIWTVDLGDMETLLGFGEGASPAVWGNKLIVNWDHQGDSFIVALDTKTGKEVWRKTRDEATSWSTPHIISVNGVTQVIVSATTNTRAYNIKNGDVIWECTGLTRNVIPTPVIKDNLCILTSGFRGNKLQAIDLSQAKGTVTAENGLLWEYDSDTPYVPSPLLYGNRLYFLKTNRAILTCLDVTTGKPLYGPQRLEGVKGIYASPLGANGNVYLPGRDGTTLVIKDSNAFEVLATNKLDDGFDASPIAIGDALFLRGKNTLYCIAD